MKFLSAEAALPLYKFAIRPCMGCHVMTSMQLNLSVLVISGIFFNKICQMVGLIL